VFSIARPLSVSKRQQRGQIELHHRVKTVASASESTKYQMDGRMPSDEGTKTDHGSNATSAALQLTPLSAVEITAITTTATTTSAINLLCV